MTESNINQSLKTLADHREMLHSVFTTAQERILIVSPFISLSAIESDNITNFVCEAVGRGVQVQIFVDSLSNCYNSGAMKTRALDGIAELVVAGAQVGVADGISNKILARDNDLFIEGSFNWLSAPGIRNGRCSIVEDARVYYGEKASNLIAQTSERIEAIGYGLATSSETDGIEVTKTGKILGLLVILALPSLIGNDLGNSKAGMACTVVMFAVFTVTYWLKAHKNRHVAAAH